MHDFNWNYVWYALAINFVIVYVVPRLIKKPTGIKIFDDIVLYLNAQKSFLLSSSIVLALVVYGTHYWIESEGGKETTTSHTPDF
jgi:hypothetical protein